MMEILIKALAWLVLIAFCVLMLGPALIMHDSTKCYKEAVKASAGLVGLLGAMAAVVVLLTVALSIVMA